jgi:predicted porin
MSAWFQCENRARLGVDTTTGQGGGTICDRNTALGLKGGFGNIFFGRWDSPLNLAQDQGRGGLLQTTGWTGVERLLLGADDSLQPVAWDFARRNPNSINYNTPNFGGFMGSLQITSTNDAIDDPPAASDQKGRAVSISGVYSSGPLEASLAYTKHDKNQASAAGGGPDADETAWLLGATYVFGPVKVGVIYTDLSADDGAGGDAEQKNWAISAAWKITGPGTLRFGYVQAGDFKGTAAVPDSGAVQWVAGYSHALSKRTTASVYYSAVKNDDNGVYNFAGMTAQGAVNPGSDTSVISLQLQHKF